MPSYDNDLVLTELATGEGSGTWGDTTNLNLELIGEAFSYGTGATFDSDANKTVTVNQVSNLYRRMFIDVTSSATLSATRTLEINPTTMSKTMVIKNSTSGSQSIIIKQGSGATVTIGNGLSKMVVLTGSGSGAAVIDVLGSIDLGANAKINGGQFGITADETATFTNKTINSANNTITNIDNGDISATAQIDASKIANGNVSNTEFQYLDGVTSAIQTQLDAALTFTVNSWITSSDNNQRFFFGNGGTTTYKATDSHIFQRGNGTNVFSVSESGGIFKGDVTAYGSPSDIALKENVDVIDNALEKVNQLKGITYDLKSDGNRLTGLVAQDLQEVLPEAVYTHKDIETKEEHLAIRYGNTVGLLVEAIKELSEEVKTLKEKK
jgi:hypothetical protein